jgi:hypothetical protein
VFETAIYGWSLVPSFDHRILLFTAGAAR